MFSELPRCLRAVGWFLFLSYLLGAPAMALAELKYHLLSEWFGYTPGFIYSVKITQFFCALLLLSPRYSALSLAGLTVFSLGAFVSQLMVHAPLAGLPPLAYSALQIWLGVQLLSCGKITNT